MNGSFASFLSTFGNSFPEEASDEHQFLLGLFGSLKNLSSTPEGREFLVTNSDGLEIISNIVKYFPQVPLDQHNSAVLLKEYIATYIIFSTTSSFLMISVYVCILSYLSLVNSSLQIDADNSFVREREYQRSRLLAELESRRNNSQGLPVGATTVAEQFALVVPQVLVQHHTRIVVEWQRQQAFKSRSARSAAKRVKCNCSQRQARWWISEIGKMHRKKRLGRCKHHHVPSVVV